MFVFLDTKAKKNFCIKYLFTLVRHSFKQIKKKGKKKEKNKNI